MKMKAKKQIKKIGLFGGSFNPIHNDHIRIIKKLLKSKVVDEVWIIPCKKHAFNKELVSSKDRIEMIRLAIKNLKNVKINKVEINSKGTTYSIKTIKKLKANYLHKFFWVVGSDILHEIKEWKKYKQFLAEVEFIIFKRKGYSIKLPEGMKVYKVFNYKKSWISSTEIRKKVREGKPLKNLIPLIIDDYIEKEELYK